MFAKTSSSISKIAFFVLALMMVLIPSHSVFAQGAGSISIEKDVLLEFPIQGAEDLPDAVTFSLYDSEDAVTPLATQAFPRGEYTLDFDFNKSDGLSSGTIARFKVNFTNKLNLGDSADSAKQPKEIWAEFSVGDSVMGSRSRLPDDAMVQLLLASDASIATYLTLAYEGDDNPIATIYRDLPLDSSSSGTDLNAYFSALPAAVLSTADATRAANWIDNGANVYTDGNAGIGTNAPAFKLDIKGGATEEGLRIMAGDGTNYWPLAFYNYAQTFLFGIRGDGNIGVGENYPAYTFSVNGSIGCKELTVTSTGWSDFVFEKGYRLPPLHEVEDFISRNKHLPGIPTEAEVEKNGVEVGKISSKLLQKIEELTLYVIDLNKENESLKVQLSNIQMELKGNSN